MNMIEQAKNVLLAAMDARNSSGMQLGPKSASAIDVLSDLIQAAQLVNLRTTGSLAPTDTLIKATITFGVEQVNVIYDMCNATWLVYRIGSDSTTRTELSFSDVWKTQDEPAVVHLAKCVAYVLQRKTLS